MTSHPRRLKNHELAPWEPQIFSICTKQFSCLAFTKFTKSDNWLRHVCMSVYCMSVYS